MQDTYCAVPVIPLHDAHEFYGVFDGHGREGELASARARDCLVLHALQGNFVANTSSDRMCSSSSAASASSSSSTSSSSAQNQRIRLKSPLLSPRQQSSAYMLSAVQHTSSVSPSESASALISEALLSIEGGTSSSSSSPSSLAETPSVSSSSSFASSSSTSSPSHGQTKLQEDDEPFRANMERAFEATDKVVLAEVENGGTTATCVYIRREKHDIWIANCGDSRCVVSRSGVAKELSTDQKPHRQDERERIEKSGGKVVYCSNGWRVDGILSVSRAIGDRKLKQYVIARPEVVRHPIGVQDEFLILGTDGLWNVFSSQEAVDVVKTAFDAHQSPAQASEALSSLALSRKSVDNVCALVVYLADNGNGEKEEQVGSCVIPETGL
jgi:protein phosphatase 2C